MGLSTHNDQVLAVHNRTLVSWFLCTRGHFAAYPALDPNTPRGNRLSESLDR